MLQVENLHVAYGHVQALQGVSLKVNPGEIVTIVGANGAGKSTLVKTIAGLLHPRQGRVMFEGEDLSKLPAHKVVRRGIGFSPEGRRVFPLLTVEENLDIGAYTRGGKDLASDKEKVYSLFSRLGERKNQLAGLMSGGEQQMLAIGRALMSRPKLLLLDEPSLGLAPVIVEDVFKLITALNQTGIAI